MAFQRPTLSELSARISADFVSRLELTGAVLRRAFVRVLSVVIAGATHMLHGHLDFLSRQLFADQAEDAYLVRHAGVFGITKTSPDYAGGTADIAGTNGSTVPAGTILVRSDGAKYEVDADETIASGVGEIAVTAVDAGADGTLLVGVVLSFESPVAGVDSTATVNASTQDGVDQEDTEGLRTRFLERLREPPHGGNDADYKAWAKEVPGVTRVWVTRLQFGPGTVAVRFVRDNDVSVIPDAGEVTAVQEHLDAVRPSHATVTAIAPTAYPVNFTIDVTPDTSAVRAAVTAELTDLLLREGEPGVTIPLASFRTAVGIAAGVTNYTLTDPVCSPTTNQLPVVGSFTWV